MAPNVTVDSMCSSTVKTPAFSLDALIAQCRLKKASVLLPISSDNPSTSKRPSFSLDAIIAECQKKKATATPPIDCQNASAIDELTQKLLLLQNSRKEVMLKTGRVSEMMDEKYPELAIALAVQKSNKKRTKAVRDTYGWRQYLGVWEMIEKANEMIANEKADRLIMYDDLAVELRTISKAIAEANLQLQSATRKRPIEPELKEGELQSPEKKKRRNE